MICIANFTIATTHSNIGDIIMQFNNIISMGP